MPSNYLNILYIPFMYPNLLNSPYPYHAILRGHNIVYIIVGALVILTFHRTLLFVVPIILVWMACYAAVGLWQYLICVEYIMFQVESHAKSHVGHFHIDLTRYSKSSMIWINLISQILIIVLTIHSTLKKYNKNSPNFSFLFFF